mgnify:CR=1 FL=1
MERVVLLKASNISIEGSINGIFLTVFELIALAIEEVLPNVSKEKPLR